MKTNIIVLLILLVINLACSNNKNGNENKDKVKHDGAVSFMYKIKKSNLIGNKLYNEFLDLFKQSILIAQSNNPQKLDSISLNKLTLDYNNFLIFLDTQIDTLNQVQEYDNEIPLRFNFVRNSIFTDSCMKELAPLIFVLFKNGLESMTIKDEEIIKKIKIAADKNQHQRQKIDQLSDEFATKYEIYEDELTKKNP